MTDVDHAADCVTCTWACSTTGTDYGEEKIKTLALEHFRNCEHTDCVLLKERRWHEDVQELVEEVVGQVNVDGLRVNGSNEVTA